VPLCQRTDLSVHDAEVYPEAETLDKRKAGPFAGRRRTARLLDVAGAKWGYGLNTRSITAGRGE
jgi:hypothetical protein